MRVKENLHIFQLQIRPTMTACHVIFISSLSFVDEKCLFFVPILECQENGVVDDGLWGSSRELTCVCVGANGVQTWRY